jgi:preprotein translocase subunit SecA
MMNTKQLIDRFTESGLMVEREIVEEIVKKEDDEIYESLFEIVRKDKYWRDGGPGNGWSPYHVFVILGLKGDEKSFEILKYMISRRDKELDMWITEHLAAVFYSFVPEYYDNIRDIGFDKSLDEYVRLAAIETLCAYAVLNPDFTEKTIGLCKRFLREEKSGNAIALVLPNMAEIKDEKLFKLVKKAYEKYDTGQIRVCNPGELEDIYEGRDPQKEYTKCTKNLWDYFSNGNLNYLFEMTYDKPKVKKIPEVKGAKEPREAEEKKENKNKVGRNELCPCGSGKKYKKCCGNPAKLKQQ